MPLTNRKRIIFLDMMRALAVLMMVEGHTVDAFLSNSFRNPDSFSFTIWYNIRGFTAPIFMFTSGVVFTYLLRLHSQPFFLNPRVKKGFIRFVTLVLIGYLLRYPTYTFFNFSFVTREQWLGFFTVDALHLIGFGLLFILILYFFATKFKLPDWIVYTFGTLFFFGLFPFTETINWINYLPIPFAAYFYHGTGSFFPFFPWAGYVVCGAILGSYLAHHFESFSSKKFSISLFAIGSGFLLLSLFLNIIDKNGYFKSNTWNYSYFLISLRVGVVIILNSIMSFVALNIKKLPELVRLVGRHTLLIYAVHVIIIYGSAWIPGFDFILDKKMNAWQSAAASVLMIFLMLWMIILWEKYKLHRKNKLTAVQS